MFTCEDLRVKSCFSRNFLSHVRNFRCWGKWGQHVKMSFLEATKCTFLRETTTERQDLRNSLGGSELSEPPKSN